MKQRKPRISIRHARADEIPACAVLYERAGRAAFTWRPKNYFERRNFLRHSLSEEIWVAVRDGKILGVLGFRRPENFIHHLYVARRAQGRGIGTRLIAAVRGASRGALELKVDAATKRRLRSTRRAASVAPRAKTRPGWIGANAGGATP